MTGSRDYNRGNVKAVYDGYAKGGFKNLLYLEQPGLEHEFPAVEYCEKAVLFLDQGLRKQAEEEYARAVKAELDGRYLPAFNSYKLAYVRGAGLPFAVECLNKAETCRIKADADSLRIIDALLGKHPDKKALLEYVQEWNGFSGVGKAMAAMEAIAKKEQPIKK